MTSNEGLNKKEQEQLSAAWARLEGQLQRTEQSPLWQQWEAQASSSHEEHSKETSVFQAQASRESRTVSVEAKLHSQTNNVPLGRAHASRNEWTGKPGRSGMVSRWLRRNKGKTVAACAAAFITLMIALPTTNEALAAWLNTFRMDNVMVVNEDDLESLMYSFVGEGEALEWNNRFGSFERKSEGSFGALTAEQAAEKLGFPIPAISVSEEQQIDISSTAAQTFVFRLNVEEINGAMRRLGADKLLPESVDGKAISFQAGQGVNIAYRQVEEGTSKQSVHVSYMKAPSIDVDSSVDVKDAYEAIIRFPALPDHLRNSLQQAVNLENGELPMPVISNRAAEKIAVKGVDVYLEEPNAGQPSVNAIWLQEGMVANAYFSGYTDKQQIVAMVSELIHP
ncbi:hypothetical protein AB4Z29_27570 [Paenibacillus sp. 2TAB23]|uniref:hypothetical protein n=1 Tax=Paenibacillus sp. 2TAB23 TaxID=3233004 RepID=UPI003F9CCAD4